MVLMRSTTSAEATCSRNVSALSPNSGAVLSSARRSKSVNAGNGGQAGASASGPVIQPSRFGFGALIGITYAGVRQEPMAASGQERKLSSDGELSFVELVVLMDVEVARVLAL